MNKRSSLAPDLRLLGLQLGTEQWDRIEIYLETLRKWRKSINLTAIQDDHDLLRLHFFEAFWAGKVFLDPSSALVDIGSGAGFPGMAIKLFCPEIPVVLIEKNLKKAMFLKTLARELSLEVPVVADRAERFQGWNKATCATCRALRPSQDLLAVLWNRGVRFLHFRGGRTGHSFKSWKLAREERFPLSENRWISLYLPDVPRGTVSGG